MDIKIRSTIENSFEDFLLFHDYSVEKLSDSVYKVVKENEFPVFLNIDKEQIFFEVDLGNIESIASKDLYFKMLDLNTEILPVSLGINNCKEDDPRLVLVESREVKNLDDNEVLKVFSSLELAVDRVEALLESIIK